MTQSPKFSNCVENENIQNLLRSLIVLIGSEVERHRWRTSLNHMHGKIHGVRTLLQKPKRIAKSRNVIMSPPGSCQLQDANSNATQVKEGIIEILERLGTRREEETEDN